MGQGLQEGFVCGKAKEGKAAILPVNIVTFLGKKIGADNPYFVAGMPVVIEGNERLRPDQAVTVEGVN